MSYGQFTGTPYDPANAPALPIRPQIRSKQAAPIKVPSIGAATYLASVFTTANAPWLVRRITVQGSEFVPAYVYIGDLVNANIVSGTSAGQFDENDTQQPIFVDANTNLTVVWVSLVPATATAFARLEYVEIP